MLAWDEKEVSGRGGNLGVGANAAGWLGESLIERAALLDDARLSRFPVPANFTLLDSKANQDIGSILVHEDTTTLSGPWDSLLSLLERSMHPRSCTAVARRSQHCPTEGTPWNLHVSLLACFAV